jgi:uncharacterized membrane protein
MKPMKDQEWTWRAIAAVVGIVLLMVALTAISSWLVWNNPAVLP